MSMYDDNDSRIDLRGSQSPQDDPDEAEFVINKLPEIEQNVVGNLEAVPLTDTENATMDPQDKVRVKFDKFVNLVASHAYEEIFDKHMDQDVIISTDLLTDLANAHEEKESKKMPAIFLVGILLGVVLTWMLLKA